MTSIRDFAPGDEEAFHRLNEAWISRFFAMESKDEYTLRNPREAILETGGRIFLACVENEPVGCCALMAMKAAPEYEVVKMAVSDAHQGAGIGRRLLAHATEQAREMGASRLYLETNGTRKTAVRLYESLGFRHLLPEEIVPSPYARAEVFMELRFKSVASPETQCARDAIPPESTPCA